VCQLIFSQLIFSGGSVGTDDRRGRAVPRRSNSPDGGVVRTPEGAIICPCGDRLADRIDGDTVVIDGAELQFRRRNDEIVCRSCGISQPVRRFRGSSPPSDSGRRRRADD
jgi:hypothetical protein